MIKYDSEIMPDRISASSNHHDGKDQANENQREDRVATHHGTKRRAVIGAFLIVLMALGCMALRCSSRSPWSSSAHTKRTSHGSIPRCQDDACRGYLRKQPTGLDVASTIDSTKEEAKADALHQERRHLRRTMTSNRHPGPIEINQSVGRQQNMKQPSSPHTRLHRDTARDLSSMTDDGCSHGNAGVGDNGDTDTRETTIGANTSKSRSRTDPIPTVPSPPPQFQSPTPAPVPNDATASTTTTSPSLLQAHSTDEPEPDAKVSSTAKMSSLAPNDAVSLTAPPTISPTSSSKTATSSGATTPDSSSDSGGIIADSSTADIIILVAVSGIAAATIISCVVVAWCLCANDRDDTRFVNNRMDNEYATNGNRRSPAKSIQPGTIIALTNETESLADTSIGDQTAGRRRKSRKSKHRGPALGSFDESSLYTTPFSVDDSAALPGLPDPSTTTLPTPLGISARTSMFGTPDRQNGGAFKTQTFLMDHRTATLSPISDRAELLEDLQIHGPVSVDDAGPVDVDNEEFFEGVLPQNLFSFQRPTVAPSFNDDSGDGDDDDSDEVSDESVHGNGMGIEIAIHGSDDDDDDDDGIDSGLMQDQRFENGPSMVNGHNMRWHANDTDSDQYNDFDRSEGHDHDHERNHTTSAGDSNGQANYESDARNGSFDQATEDAFGWETGTEQSVDLDESPFVNSSDGSGGDEDGSSGENRQRWNDNDNWSNGFESNGSFSNKENDSSVFSVSLSAASKSTRQMANTTSFFANQARHPNAIRPLAKPWADVKIRHKDPQDQMATEAPLPSTIRTAMKQTNKTSSPSALQQKVPDLTPSNKQRQETHTQKQKQHKMRKVHFKLPPSPRDTPENVHYFGDNLSTDLSTSVMSGPSRQTTQTAGQSESTWASFPNPTQTKETGRYVAPSELEKRLRQLHDGDLRSYDGFDAHSADSDYVREHPYVSATQEQDVSIAEATTGNLSENTDGANFTNPSMSLPTLDEEIAAAATILPTSSTQTWTDANRMRLGEMLSRQHGGHHDGVDSSNAAATGQSTLDDDISESTGSTGMSPSPWLYNKVEEALGPQSIAADLESMSARSSAGSVRSTKSSIVSYGSSLVSHRSSTAPSLSDIAPQMLEHELKRLGRQLDAIEHAETQHQTSQAKANSKSSKASITSTTKAQAPPKRKGTSRIRSHSGNDDERERTITAPPGVLGVILAIRKDGRGIAIAQVRDNSLLRGKVSVGDTLVAVDDEDVSGMQVEQIKAMISSKINQERRLTVVGVRSDAEV